MGKSYSQKVKERSNRSKNDRKDKVKRTDGNEREFPLVPLIVLGVVVLLIGGSVFAFVVQSTGNGDNGSDEPDEGDEDNGGPSYMDIALQDVDGGVYRLNEDLGKVIVLDMFATWCSPCRTQIVELRRLKDEMGSEDMVIISADMDTQETAQQAKVFKQENGADWAFVMSTEEFNTQFPTEAIPTLYILDKSGNTAESHQGLLGADELKGLVEPLL